MTWEFPPFIAGGMGMACYGLARALLEIGVDVDLVLPTTDDVYFPLRKVSDVDTMPVHHMYRTNDGTHTTNHTLTLRERLKLLGVSSFPETYLTPGYNFESTLENVWNLSFTKTHELDLVKMHLGGNENLFKKVREFTARMVRNAHNFQCDAIHVHDWLTYPAGILLKNLLKKPLITHIHATEFDRAGGPGDHRIHNIEYAGMNQADRVLAVSQYTAQMIMDRYCVDSKKIRIVHNAYSFTSEVNIDKKRKLFRDPLVLFMGRVTLQKGPDYFLRMAKKVLDRVPNVRFVMAGSGDMFSKILMSAASKNLKDRFLFAGFLNREQVEEMLSATDIFVLPSVSEPFGIVPLEAMAFGVVTIVSKQSGVSEVIKNAHKVDFWDIDKTSNIIIDLLENPVERKKMAKAGQEEVLEIGWKEAAQKTKNAYEEVVCFT